jgi:7-carboxy-7-deazaguanine synthase
MTPKANILEMFQSIQGEGKYAGVRQVFVRFFECNMHCVWCDTPHSIGDTTRRYKEYTLDELSNAIDTLSAGCHSVSLTGGEPLMQTPFIKELLPLLKQKSLPSYLETNGIFYNELKTIIDDIDIVAMDIKLPSSTKQKPFWNEHAEFLKVARVKDTFIKTVISSDTSKEDVDRATNLVADIDPNILFILQPNTFDMQNGVIKKCIDFQDDCSKKLKQVRVMPQVHKFMKLR